MGTRSASCWRVLALVGSVLLLAASCAPAGPGPDELAATEGFGVTMPGAEQFGGYGVAARATITGGERAFAVRYFVTEDGRPAVLAWHDATLQGLGWVRGKSVAPIYWGPGDEAHAWCRGNFHLGLTFSRRDDPRYEPPSTWRPEDTVYELSIAYRPIEDSGFRVCEPTPPPVRTVVLFLLAVALVGAAELLVARRAGRPAAMRSAGWSAVGLLGVAWLAFHDSVGDPVATFPTWLVLAILATAALGLTRPVRPSLSEVAANLAARIRR